MTIRQILVYLLTATVLTLIAFAILMGGYAVAATLGDSFGALWLWRGAIFAGLLWLLSIISLILAVTIAILTDPRRAEERSDPRI